MSKNQPGSIAISSRRIITIAIAITIAITKIMECTAGRIGNFGANCWGGSFGALGNDCPSWGVHRWHGIFIQNHWHAIFVGTRKTRQCPITPLLSLNLGLLFRLQASPCGMRVAIELHASDVHP